MTGFSWQDNNRFSRCLWLLALFFLPACAGVHNSPPILMGMNYHEARKAILQNGWLPAKGVPSYDKISAPAHHLRDMGYAEVEDCAGVGTTAPCIFYFQNNAGEYLKIGTEGEDNGGRAYPRIVYAAIRNDMD